MEEAAERRNKSRQTIWRWTRQLGMLIHYKLGNQILVSEHDVMTIQDPKMGNPEWVDGRGDRGSHDGLDEEQRRMKEQLLKQLGEKYPNIYCEIEEVRLGNRILATWVDRSKKKLIGYFPLQAYPRDAGIETAAKQTV